MTRFVQCVLLLSLVILPALGAPATAGAQSPACQQLLPHGIYEGSTSVVMDVKGFEGPILVQEFTYNDTGQLSLTLDCSVSAGTYRWNVYRTIMLFPGATPIECLYTVDLSQPSGSVVVGTNGQPRIDVRWGQGVINDNDCIGPGPADLAATWQFSLSGPPQDRTIKGDFRIKWDDPDGQDYDDLAQMFTDQGFQVTLAKGWTLTRRPEPKVQGLTATLRQFFLAGIPVTNHYEAALNWDGAGPGTAQFLLGNEPPREMTVTGNIGSLDLPLGSIQGTGDIPISVEAKLDGRVHRLDGLGPLTLVPVPSWAGPFNLQAQVVAPDSVRYSGVFAVPSKPLDAHVVLPAFIPYVGGTWGLLPTQLRLALAANSLGSRETGSVSAQGGFGLGERTFALSASGNIYGTLTRDSLNFESDELSLTTPRMALQKRVGLASLIPGAEALYGASVLGTALQALNSAVGVTADIHGTMTGRGRLGVSGSTLALTEVSYEAALGMSVTGGIPDNPLLFASVSGGGDGSLRMQFIPTAKVVACQVLLSFGLRAGAFGFTPLQLQHTWSLYSCTAVSGQTVLVAAGPTAPGLLAPTMTYGSAGPVPVETSVSLPQLTNGLPETVLAESTSLQARPVLAAGANGRLALAWNSVSASGAADAVSLRVFDGSAWGGVLVVSLGRPSFTPSIQFDAAGKLLVAWAEAQTPPDPAGLTVPFARSLDIAWAEVDPTAGQVVRRGSVASDNIMDFAPRLSAASDGTIWLAWQSSPGTNLAGSAQAPNHLKAAAWTGAGWTATETAAQNGVGTLFWDVSALDANRVWMVADVDVDGDLGTAADREIYVYRRTSAGWAAAHRLTNDAVIDSGPLLALTSDGQPVMAWRHGESVLGLVGDPTSTQPQLWFDEGAGVGPMLGGGRLVTSGDGARALLWASGTAQGQDIWMSRFDPATKGWSRPAPLFRSNEQQSALSASTLPGGDIVLGLAAAPVTSQSVTFDGGGVAMVPTVGDAARLVVARIPAGYVPPQEGGKLFLPLVTR